MRFFTCIYIHTHTYCQFVYLHAREMKGGDFFLQNIQLLFFINDNEILNGMQWLEIKLMLQNQS